MNWYCLLHKVVFINVKTLSIKYDVLIQIINICIFSGVNINFTSNLSNVTARIEMCLGTGDQVPANSGGLGSMNTILMFKVVRSSGVFL